MAIYRIGVVPKAGVNVANTVMWQIRSPATKRTRILEIGVSVAVSPTTAPRFAIARDTAVGATPTSSLFLANDPADPAALTNLDTAWGTAPTFTTTGPFLGPVAALPVTAGAFYIWTFPNPLVLANSAGLVIANLAATGATLGSFTFYAVVDE